MALTNHGFDSIHKKFISSGWILKENKNNMMIYVDPINENDMFCIDIKLDSIDVTIPIANSNIQYKTSLNDYFLANEYLEMHLDNFMNTETRFIKDKI